MPFQGDIRLNVPANFKKSIGHLILMFENFKKVSIEKLILVFCLDGHDTTLSTQHNNTQHDDTQHNDTQHSDIQHYHD
jgi:hypothetical protein